VKTTISGLTQPAVAMTPASFLQKKRILKEIYSIEEARALRDKQRNHDAFSCQNFALPSLAYFERIMTVYTWLSIQERE
jgi:hypothetical protein